MNPKVIPKLIFDSKKQTAVVSADQGNRFRAVFSMGGMTCTLTDAQALLQEAAEDLISHIQRMWRRGVRANGMTLEPRAKMASTQGIWRKMPQEQIAEYERQILTGTFKLIQRKKLRGKARASRHRASPGYARALFRMKAWMKNVKKKYKYQGEQFIPQAGKPAANWSGLLVNSLRASPIRVNSKTGRIPRKCTVRLQVAPSRGEYAKVKKLLAMGPASYPMVEAKRRIRRGARGQTLIKNWNAAPVSKGDIMLLWRKYKRLRSIMRKVGL